MRGAIGTGGGKIIQLGQHHGLNYRKAFGGAMGPIAVGLRQRQAVEKFPGGAPR